MNNLYTYFDGSKSPKEKMLEIITDKISTADKAFEKTFGYSSYDKPFVYVWVEMNVKEKG